MVKRFKVRTLNIEVPDNILKINNNFFVEKQLYSDTDLVEEFVFIDGDMEVCSYNVPDSIWESNWKFLNEYAV